jgi:putative DNA primase/helicase
MNDFESFLRSLGLRPRTIAADGRWRRCPTESHPKKRNGAYKLAPDGRVGWAQDWSTMSEPVTWRPGADAELPELDVAAYQRRQEDAQREAEHATAAAREFYETAAPLRGSHPYLEAHGLDMRGCEGLRVDSLGWLVVPAMVGRTLMSVQRISPTGEKRFWTGAPIGGTCYVIDRPGAPVTVLCEGLATGLACFAAMPHARVVIGWNAGNLVAIPARELTGLVVIAADNDHETEARIGKNPGLEAARKAAEVLGCGIAYPTGIRGSDWCDYRMERLAARLEQKGRWATPSLVQGAVDAEIRAALMREARFRGAA